jgi:RNase H-fold protein (predicted Holliday junction resolvase)
MKPLILAVDPGKDKTGVALVDTDGRIEAFTVILMQNFKESFAAFVKDRTIERCILGNGTTSPAMKQYLESTYPEWPLTVIDEAYSTDEARHLYWQLYPPKGLKKLLPLSLLTPPGNMDGLAAVVLARRYLKAASHKTVEK